MVGGAMRLLMLCTNWNPSLARYLQFFEAFVASVLHAEGNFPALAVDERPEPRASFLFFGLFLALGPGFGLLLMSLNRGRAFWWSGLLVFLCWQVSVCGLIGYVLWP